MLESAVTLWQFLLGLVTLITPPSVGLARLYTRVSVLEAKVQATEGVLGELKTQQGSIMRDLTDVKEMLARITGYVESRNEKH